MDPSCFLLSCTGTVVDNELFCEEREPSDTSWHLALYQVNMIKTWAFSIIKLSLEVALWKSTDNHDMLKFFWIRILLF